MVFALVVAALLLLGLVSAQVDYYEILGVDIESSDKEIKKAFRALSLKFHPDKNPGDQEAARKFLEVNEAFDVLSNEDLRMVYDMDGHEGVDKHKKGGGRQQQQDPFAMMFGGGQQQGRQKGPDFKTYYDVTLADLYNGGERAMQISRNVLCKACKGTGGKDGKMNVCKTCNGSGQVTRLQRLGPGFNVQMQQPCDACGGKGKSPIAACPKCRGQKLEKQSKTLEIIIEKGMPDGYEMVFKRAGEQNPATTPGDVILVFKTQPHAFLVRDGNNLRMNMELTLKEALLGFNKHFTHLDGRQVAVSRGPVVTPPDFVMKMTGEGMPFHEVSSEKGDLYITFKIRFPNQLSNPQKQAIELLP